MTLGPRLYMYYNRFAHEQEAIRSPKQRVLHPLDTLTPLPQGCRLLGMGVP
jgi:hypothetical protein